MAINAISSVIVLIVLPFSYAVSRHLSGRDVRTPYGWLKGQQHCRIVPGAMPNRHSQARPTHPGDPGAPLTILDDPWALH
jgi:hypothetical protein